MQIFLISSLKLLVFSFAVLLPCKAEDYDIADVSSEESDKPLKQSWQELMEDENTNKRIFSIKYEVLAGKVDCFYQKVRPYDYAFIESEVLTYVQDDEDGDKIGIYVWNNESDEIVNHVEWGRGLSFDDDTVANSSEGGVYKICYNNTEDFENFKHVSLFFSSYSLDWGEQIKELAIIANVTGTLASGVKKLQANIISAIRYIQHSAALHSRSLFYAEDLNAKVLYWSIISCIVILSTGFMQVYFIKKLFDR